MHDMNESLRAALNHGRKRDEIIADMKERGFTIIEAIKSTRELFGLSLGQAKELVCQHPAWAETARESADFQNALLEAFEEISPDKLESK
jgi:ribosomal protein L7/L12